MDEVASVRELVKMGKEATEGIGVGDQNSIGGSVGVWARIQLRGKHRTEVTDATEGDLGWVAKILSVSSAGVWARNQVQRKSIAQRSQRGIAVGGQNSISDSVGVRAGINLSATDKAFLRAARV